MYWISNWLPHCFMKKSMTYDRITNTKSFEFFCVFLQKYEKMRSRIFQKWCILHPNVSKQIHNARQQKINVNEISYSHLNMMKCKFTYSRSWEIANCRIFIQQSDVMLNSTRRQWNFILPITNSQETAHCFSQPKNQPHILRRSRDGASPSVISLGDSQRKSRADIIH